MAKVLETSLDWGVASRALSGQPASGDLHLVRPVRHGALVAVVDGLGHGEEAAAAARTAINAIERFAEEDPIELVERCHGLLKGTRGVVLSVARFDQGRDTMTWLGVGNVEGVLRRASANAKLAPATLIARGGIVGSALPPLHVVALPVRRGDALVFATDGIKSGFADHLTDVDPPQRLADRILERCAKGNDDSLVLVARYGGGGAGGAGGGGVGGGGGGT